MQFISNALSNVQYGVSALGNVEVKECWSEAKLANDEAKMRACMAKTISTWLAVFVSEDGLNCLLAAKRDIGMFRACNANGATAQVDALQSPPEREARQFVSFAFRDFTLGYDVLSKQEALTCWSEGKDDEEKMHACLAKTFSSWLAVLVSEEGLNCLLTAKDNADKIRACNVHRASAPVDGNQSLAQAGAAWREVQEFISNAFMKFALFGRCLGNEEALECWSEGKDDEDKMHACMAKTISTWLGVFRSEEGINCLLAAKYSPRKIRACINPNGGNNRGTSLANTKANGATAVTTNFLLGASLAILLLVRDS